MIKSPFNPKNWLFSNSERSFQGSFDPDCLSSIFGCATNEELEKALADLATGYQISFFSFFRVDPPWREFMQIIGYPTGISDEQSKALCGSLKYAHQHGDGDGSGLLSKGPGNRICRKLAEFLKKPVEAAYSVVFNRTSRRDIVLLIAFGKTVHVSKRFDSQILVMAYYIHTKYREIQQVEFSDQRLAAVEKIVREFRRSMVDLKKEIKLDTILAALSTIVPEGFRALSLWLYNKAQYQSGQNLILRHATDWTYSNRDMKYLDIDDSLTGRAINERRIQVYTDVLSEPLYKLKAYAREQGFNQLIVAPLFELSGEPLGALNVYTADDFVIEENFIKALSTYAAAFALGLEAQEMQEKLSTLNNIISSYKDLDTITSEESFYNYLVKSLKNGDIIGVEGASVFTTIPEDERLALAATTGVEGPWKIGDKAYSFGEGLTGSVAQQGRTIIENDMQKYTKDRPGKVVDKTKRKCMTWIGSPIKDPSTNEVLGVIRCANKKPGIKWPEAFFTVLDQRVLEFLAFISGQLIQNMRIFKHVQKAKRVSETALRHQNEFIQSLTHEVNIPVNAILGRAGLLKAYLEDVALSNREKIKLLFEDIEINCFHINMVTRTWSLSQPVFEKVNIITEIVVRVKYVMERVAKEKHIDINYEVPEERVPDYRIDKSRMIQVMYNLVNNAIKYGDKNTGIDIVVDYKFNGTLKISVINQGIGITEEEKSEIFKQYYRTEAAKRRHPSGTGVGLYYSKKIIEEDHGGRLILERASDPTVFAFELPPERSL